MYIHIYIYIYIHNQMIYRPWEPGLWAMFERSAGEAALIGADVVYIIYIYTNISLSLYIYIYRYIHT